MDRARSAAPSNGFSLVEVLIAIFLLTISAAGLAQLFAYAARANLASRSQTSTAILAVQKMEQLHSLTWSYSRVAPGLWGPASDTTTNLSVDPPGNDGPGLAASPDGTLDENTPFYVDFVDANGNWIGTGSKPVAGTAYIRRWSIKPLASSPANTLVFQVVARTLAREARRRAAGAVIDETRLVSLKTRKVG